MKQSRHTLRFLITTLWTLSALPGVFTASARAEVSEKEVPSRTILYITRHAEDVPELVGSDPSFTVTFNNCNADGSCCEEDLNPLGKRRAAALADWFQARGLTRILTHVIASHKVRTRQTVARIAQLAGLGGDLDGDGDLDGTDVDQAPGDGVINIPSTPSECTPGFTSSSSARGPQRDYLAALPLGSRAVLCSHSTVIYPLLQDFGIDTSDPAKFPKDSRGRVVGFNNLWVVELRPVTTGGVASLQGRLLAHLVLDLKLGVSLVERPDPDRSERIEKGDAK
jgi:hypothetical protein